MSICYQLVNAKNALHLKYTTRAELTAFHWHAQRIAECQKKEHVSSALNSKLVILTIL